MNKQELKEAVGELNLVDTVFEADGVSYIDTAVSIMQVYDLINQLDEPEKVVVPKFVADEFDCNKKAYWEVDEAKDIPHVLKCAFGNNEKPYEFLDWVRDNPEDYVMAVRNGYEVEKEKKYHIYDKSTKGYLGYNADKTRLSWYTRRFPNDEFTEQEIREIDERYWPFAVEVTE